MRKKIHCPLCKGDSINFLFEGKDRMHGVKGVFNTYECKNCKSLFIHPQPSANELEKYYPKDKYYSYYRMDPNKNIKNRFLDALYLLYFSDRGNLFFKIIFLPIRPILRTTRIIPGGKFLDIGCGSGEFLLRMKGLGMKCYGVEPGGFDKDFAKRHDIKIYNGTLLDAHYPKDYFEVISLNHVLEHVSYPSEELTELYRILKPGGTLIISVPNINSLAYKIFKERWVQLDVPRHLFCFSDSGLKKLAIKTGFKVLKLRYNSKGFQFLGSLRYTLTDLTNNEVLLENSRIIHNKILNYILLPLSSILNILRFGDSIELILTK